MSASVYSQITEEAKQADIQTYDLYTSAKWSELIDAGNKALSKGIDFYYLRMRLGIAYYSLNNYMSAAEHLKQALEYVPKDPAAYEYLYWSLVYSGRDREARLLASEMPEKLKSDIKAIPEKMVKDFYAEGGLMFNGDYKENPYSGFGTDTLIYGEQKPDKKSNYISLNFNIIPWKRLTIFTGYNNINITSNRKIVSIGNAPENFEVSTIQNEFYLNAGVYTGKGFTLSGILHYLNVKVNDVSAAVNTTTGGITYTKTSNTLNDYVGLFSIEKSLNHFKFILGNSYSSLNKGKQIQNGLTIVYFPLGNLDLYSVTDLVVHSENKEDTLINPSGSYLTRGIVKQKVGVKVIDKLWLEAFYMFGNAENYHEDNAYVVFNSVNVMNNRFGINLISPITSNLQISLRYQYYKQDVPELVYETATTYKFIEKSNFFHKIIGSIKWTF